ncbi:hypothetical protein FRC10_010479 [Ceratobasidium sp. 414]|nr:hypothetical protein FRC10_010479 [Ceratobasidium sp. 414]
MGDGEARSVLEKKLDPFFKGLRTLYLESFYLQLPNITCRNLVELSLVDPQAQGNESAAELAHLLNSNPGLRSVKLRGFVCDALGEPEEILLPSLRILEIYGLDERFMFWFLLVLMPGNHDLDICLDTFVPGEFEEEVIATLLASFFARASVKSLYLKEVVAVPLAPVLRSLPDLQHLTLTECPIDYMSFNGIADVARFLVELHTIDLNDCDIGADDELDPDLRTLLTLPSLRTIRYSGGSLEEWDVFHDLLMDEGITAQVIKSPDSRFLALPSPFA